MKPCQQPSPTLESGELPHSVLWLDVLATIPAALAGGTRP